MDSLSPDLLLRLRSLGLCSSRELRRCRARVRRLSRDLPAFDSVWLDALVQQGALTPFQVQVITDSDPSELAIGPFVLVDRTGGDGGAETFRARRNGQSTLRELTLLPMRFGDPGVVLDRLESMIAKLQDVVAPQIDRPLAARQEGDRFVVVAPWHDGKRLDELLVRRGRFPVEVALEVARQIAGGLEGLERVGLIHGDLRLRNVSIDRLGRLRLKHVGVLATLELAHGLRTDLPLDVYDGIAPELVDTRAERTLTSEMYSLGCLLWQLLAGRPPFPTADPLGKLAAHQTRRIDDVREWVPEVPAHVAGLLQRMSSPDPRQRPGSFSEVTQLLHHANSHRSTILRRFVRRFESAAPRSTSAVRSNAASRSTTAVATLLLVALVAGVWLDGDLRSQVQRIADAAINAADSKRPTSTRTAPTVADSAESGGEARASEAGSESSLQPLPTPRQGVVRLDGNGPYAASEFAVVGPLTIVGSDGAQPVIVVDSKPLRLTGTRVILENVAVTRGLGPGSEWFPIIEATAQDFGLVDCLIESAAEPGSPTTDAAHRRAAIVWERIDEDSVVGGRIGCVNTAFVTDEDVIHCRAAPSSVRFSNSVHVGSGTLVRLAGMSLTRPLPIVLQNVTLRGSGGIVSTTASTNERPSAISMLVEHSLLSLHPAGGVVELRGVAAPQEIDELLMACRINGVDSFLQTGSALAVQQLSGGGTAALDARSMPVEGLQFASLGFVGEVGDGWSGARPDRSRTNALGAGSAGCDLDRFARLPKRAYNLGPMPHSPQPARVADAEPTSRSQ